MYRYFFLLVPLLSACEPNAETPATDKKAGAPHEKKIISHTVQDEMSPLGFWETHIEYPIFTDSSKSAALTAINDDVSLMTEKYNCDDDKGDKQFTASITFLNDSVVSIQFTDTWLCAGMPHPDGRLGAITYSIQTGKPITLTNELIDSKRNDFSQKIITQLNQALKIKEDADTCAQALNWSYFYLTKKGITFAYTTDDYSESHCTTEIQVHTKDLQQYLNKDSILSR